MWASSDDPNRPWRGDGEHGAGDQRYIDQAIAKVLTDSNAYAQKTAEPLISAIADAQKTLDMISQAGDNDIIAAATECLEKLSTRVDVAESVATELDLSLATAKERIRDEVAELDRRLAAAKEGMTVAEQWLVQERARQTAAAGVKMATADEVAAVTTALASLKSQIAETKTELAGRVDGLATGQKDLEKSTVCGCFGLNLSKSKGRP